MTTKVISYNYTHRRISSVGVFLKIYITYKFANCYQVGAVAYPERFEDVDPTEKLDEITEFFLGQPLSSDLAEAGCEFKQIELSEL